MVTNILEGICRSILGFAPPSPTRTTPLPHPPEHHPSPTRTSPLPTRISPLPPTGTSPLPLPPEHHPSLSHQNITPPPPTRTSPSSTRRSYISYNNYLRYLRRFTDGSPSRSTVVLHHIGVYLCYTVRNLMLTNEMLLPLSLSYLDWNYCRKSLIFSVYSSNDN